MALSPLHLFLIVQPKAPWRTTSFKSCQFGYTKVHRLGFGSSAADWVGVLNGHGLKDIPAISLWWQIPRYLTEDDLFNLRAHAERYRLVQFRKHASESRRLWGRSDFTREELEIKGREAGWRHHHDPTQLADFHGLTLLREDFIGTLERIQEKSLKLKDPKVWVREALLQNFDLRFVERS